jgi:hypothetical protein
MTAMPRPCPEHADAHELCPLCPDHPEPDPRLDPRERYHAVWSALVADLNELESLAAFAPSHIYASWVSARWLPGRARSGPARSRGRLTTFSEGKGETWTTAWAKH